MFNFSDWNDEDADSQPVNDSPERDLAAAILIMAIKDARRVPIDRRLCARKEQLEAIYALYYSPAIAVCCELVGVDRELLLQGLALQRPTQRRQIQRNRQRRHPAPSEAQRRQRGAG